MHDYLRAVGFRGIASRKEEDLLINLVLSEPDEKKYFERNTDSTFVEVRKYFGSGFGIAVRGEYDSADQFHYDYYYPFFKSGCVTQEDFVEFEKHAANSAIAGICDDIHIGVALIFYLQNVAHLLNVQRGELPKKGPKAVNLSALSTDGTILIPLSRTPKKTGGPGKKSGPSRESLIAAARDGNEEAIESLTMEDMDLYSSLSRRIQKEDLLSIVDTCIMPYGIDSDKYYVIGDIVDVERVENHQTHEAVYRLEINANDILFGLCINEQDVFGEPAVGRRFKGNMWLQGAVHFLD